MTDQPTVQHPRQEKSLPLSPRDRWSLWGVPVVPALLVVAAVVGCSVYANLSLRVTDPKDYKYFPPFKPHFNHNHNKHLGAEYLNIAKAIVAGKGFSSPFGEDTGPTAWMPPVLPYLMAGIMWLTDSDLDVLMWVILVLQGLTLIATGLLVVTLGSKSAGRAGSTLAALIFVIMIWINFRLCFQVTHDCWLVLLALTSLVAGLCWYRPFQSVWRSAGWGAFGGLCALISPIVGMTWAVLTCALALRQWKWWHLGIAALCSVLVVTPWTIRNYQVFGRWMAVKSNAMYEFFQSQCQQTDGLLQHKTFGSHPYGRPNRARYEYKQMGEIAFIDAKAELFWKDVKAKPVDFLDRVAFRFLGATLWYVPLNRTDEPKHQVVYWQQRITHPLAFLATLVLIYSSFWRPLTQEQWLVLGVYLCYLTPYIIVSYYDRYAMPLIGVKALLIFWMVDRFLQLLPARKKKKRKKKRPIVVAPNQAT
jgi:hypothetical protein